jgi:hypothetical protein
MSYALAAYAIVLGAVAGYGVMLARERRRLVRDAGAGQNRG